MSDFATSAKQIYERVRSAGKVLVLVHPHTDGDNIGAALAMYEWCRTLPLKIALFCEGEIPKMYQFLPHVEEIQSDREILRESWDVVCVFDSSEPEYAGLNSILPEFSAKPFVINIDHHHSNALFGDLNLVDRGASATVEVLHRFFTLNNIVVTKTMATGMFLGVVFDTGRFRNAATTSGSLETAANLLLTGVRPTATEPVDRNKTVGALKLWGLVLSRLTRMPSGCTVSYLTRQDFTNCGATDEDAESITNFLQTLKDVPAVVLLKEKLAQSPVLRDNEASPPTCDSLWRGGIMISGSCRTTRDDVNVAALSGQFGGGGHKKAAGFLVGGTITFHDSRFTIHATDPRGQKLAEWLEKGAPLD